MKDIPGFEDLYAITKEGKVWSHPKHSNRKGKFLKGYTMPLKYRQVNLYLNKKSQSYLIHRLVALTYISNPKNLPEVNHKDGNQRNNSIKNLEWVTSKENSTHSWKNGFSHGKLTFDQIKEIRKKHKEGISQLKLAKLYKVKQATISYLVNNKSWFHVN